MKAESDWIESNLEEVCVRITDGSHYSPKSVLDGLPMASVKDLTPYGINIESCRLISHEDFSNLVRQDCQPQEGDVLIAKDGASALDTVCLFNKPIKVVLLSSVAILRPDGRKILPLFLRYYLDAGTTRSYLKGGFITGAAIPRVILKDFKRARIRMPGIHIQKKIASILSAYDDLIENNLRRIKILEDMAQLLYREWFVNFRFPGHETIRTVDSPLGKIPEGWTTVPLGIIAGEVRRGVSPDAIDPETPYIGLEHMPRKSIALSEWGKARDVQSMKLSFQKGEILFGKIRPYFHKVGVAPFDGVCSTDAIVIIAKSQEVFPYVLGCVSSDEFVAHATQTSQGTKMPRASWDVLVEFPVVLPSPPILARFSEFMDDILAVIQNSVVINYNLRQTRDILLPKLISGEIDVSDLDIKIREELG